VIDITEQWEHDEQRAMEMEIEKLRERVRELSSDPALEFCHRFAVLMECMQLSDDANQYWYEATQLLADYREADHKWRESMGEPYVSGFGKD
jgi:hypothetical protein